MSNPSPGTRSSKAVGSHMEENVRFSLSSTRAKRRDVGDDPRPRRDLRCASTRVNDRGSAITHAHVVVFVSSLAGESGDRGVYSPSYKRSFRFELQRGETRDVDGWRAPAYYKARETPRYPKLNLAAGARSRRNTTRREIKTSGESLGTCPPPFMSRYAREGWKEVRLFLDSRSLTVVGRRPPRASFANARPYQSAPHSFTALGDARNFTGTPRDPLSISRSSASSTSVHGAHIFVESERATHVNVGKSGFITLPESRV